MVNASGFASIPFLRQPNKPIAPRPVAKGGSNREGSGCAPSRARSAVALDLGERASGLGLSPQLSFNQFFNRRPLAEFVEKFIDRFFQRHWCGCGHRLNTIKADCFPSASPFPR